MKTLDTKFMGSKRAILPFITDRIKTLRFETALDAFSGSASVAYALKKLGVQVHANDFLKFSYHIARATIENNGTQLRDDDLAKLLRPNRKAGDFVQATFHSLYFSPDDNYFLDNLWSNIRELQSPLKRSLALAAASMAAMKKRPRGIFTFTGRKGWDGRKDLRLSMQEQFLQAVRRLNKSVFSNSKKNKAVCANVFDLDPKGYDLVYIDTPYVSHHSDCDYVRRYHFVEGYCTYWQDVELMPDTLTKKIRSYPTAFSRKRTASDAFHRLFTHFRDSVLVVSYSSNGIPSRNEMVKLLKETKQSVRVYETPHLYSFGNHNHKVGNNNNGVLEYLFVAS